MALLMSVALAFGEMLERRLLKEVLFTVNSGESLKALWVAFEINSEASARL